MNDRTDKVAQQLTDALSAVRNEIAKAESGEETVDSVSQLQKVAGSLQTMLDALKQGAMPSREDRGMGVWRYVIDSWPYRSELRRKVVEAELAYDRL